MNVNEISRLLQVYESQIKSSSDSSNSLMFELVLQSLIQNASVLDEMNSIEGSETSPHYVGQSGDTSNEIMNAINLSSQKYGVDGDLIKSVIQQESGFDSNAVSSAGAQGLMQLMPQTADSLGVENPFDALENIDGGTKYLKTLLDAFKGDPKLALAAYNGGIGRMNKLGVDTDQEINKMPLETQNYVNRVIRNYEKYRAQDK